MFRFLFSESLSAKHIFTNNHSKYFATALRSLQTSGKIKIHKHLFLMKIKKAYYLNLQNQYQLKQCNPLQSFSNIS